MLGSYPSRKPRRHPEGGTTEARPNVPFGTGGNLPGHHPTPLQKGVRSFKAGDSRLPAGQASSFVVGVTKKKEAVVDVIEKK